jgi:hypothetical protein
MMVFSGPMKHIRYSTPAFFLLTAIILVTVMLVLRIVNLNGGTFTYSLDDPYIHLTLADQILRGHYGLNDGEFASPSSSVLWPFLLAPFMWLPWAHMIPLIINIAACMATALVAHRVLRHVWGDYAVPATLLLLLFTNTIGLVFTGMEHSLQVLLALAIVAALVDITEGRELPRWLGPAIFIAPLIRYELLSVSLGAVALLAVRRHYRYLVAAALSVAVLAGFSYFLWLHSGSAMPASVLAKITDFAGSPNNIVAMNITAGTLLVLYPLFYDNKPRTALFCYMLAVTFAHLAFGKSGWLSRYEVYVLAPALMLLLYYAPLSGLFSWRGQKVSRKILAATALAASLYPLNTYYYVYALMTMSVPGASHAIYLQQGQMRRFLDEAGSPVVAVNDIGLVSYRNPAYVFDVIGLGSSERQHKKRFAGYEWLDTASQYRVEVGMVYSLWFPPAYIPKSWVPLGELHLLWFPGMIYNPVGSNTVTFYATSQQKAKELGPVVKRWSETLPGNPTKNDLIGAAIAL